MIEILQMGGRRENCVGRVTVSLKVSDKYADIKTEDKING
jgi:hypothetical protein